MDVTPLIVTAERLGHSDIFCDLSGEDLVALAKLCEEKNLLEGEVILREGEPATTLFLVERGKLALEKKIQIGRHSTPRNATIDYVNPGQTAGFSSLVTPYIYSTSAVCVEPTRVIMITGEDVRSFLKTHPTSGLFVMNKIATIIGDRYRNSIDTLTYFLSIVSHELRSPLAAVENYLQTILGGYAGELNQKQQRMVERSVLRVTDLSTLIADVVDLARMRPEEIQADFEWFDPGEVGIESIEDTRLAAAEKSIEIKVKPPPSFEPVIGARRRMRQVLTNLLNNAVKFSPTETTIIFSARYDPESLIFEVENSGTCIPPDEIPHIFKDFYRASTAGTTPGAGLGLSIAKKIVDAHKGKIVVTNLDEDGKESGTRFTVIIPRNLMTPEMRRQEWRNNLT